MRAAARALPLLLLLAPPACERAQQPAPAAQAPGAGPAAATPALDWPPDLRLPSDGALVLAPGAEERWSARPLVHTPRYFLAEGWADGRTLWGLAGTRPTRVSAEGTGTAAWDATAWSAALAPDGERLAWLDESGLWVGARVGEPRLTLERGASAAPAGDLSGPLLWSPDGERVLARWTEEWSSTYAAVEVGTGAVAPLATRLEGYSLVDAFGWLDPQRVLFATQAVRDRQGRSEYREAGGYRTDLAVHDLEDSSYRPVTSVPDEVHLRPLGRWGENGVLVGEAGGDRHRLLRYWVYDTRRWTRRPLELPPGHRAAVHDTVAAVVVDPDPADAEIHRLWLWRADTGPRPLAMVRARDLRVHWSPSGGQIAISAAVEEEGVSRYHTWVVEEAGG